MNLPDSLHSLADTAALVEARLKAKRIALTLGGEPTYVPFDPVGSEWSHSAVGPTKLRHGYALADALAKEALRGALTFFSPGKSYPGETNPRWALILLWNQDGTPLLPEALLQKGKPVQRAAFEKFRDALAAALGMPRVFREARDPNNNSRRVVALPLDHDGKKWVTDIWKFPGRSRTIPLLPAEGPAGLRLPLHLLPDEAMRRALTLELRNGTLHVFLPPVAQQPFLALLDHLVRLLEKFHISRFRFEGYVPEDLEDRWGKLGIATDPGVLEINLPPCTTWAEYAHWLALLEDAATSVKLRSCKRPAPGVETGTGGGNHLLFGGPTLDHNPFFTRPAWLVSIIRYWQHHPVLSYLFTGIYVGGSSQAPRPDESARALLDLELAYRHLESVPVLHKGDHRLLIGETLRHIHIDSSGNTHRAEMSFDKFWNPSAPNGCLGLIEFRALESLPHAHWSSAIALLWRALAVMLLERPFREPLVDHGDRLKDAFFLPSFLQADLNAVLHDLATAGFPCPSEIFRAIFDWRFPRLLDHRSGGLVVRKALESWPLLCDTPSEGGTTSRFVDSSMDRLEILAAPDLATTHRVLIGGRELPLQPFPDGTHGAGLRYRRTALYPSLHPGIPIQLPLDLSLVHRKSGKIEASYRLKETDLTFRPRKPSAKAEKGPPLRSLHDGGLTCDLRL